MSSIAEFFSELQRRSVIRAAIVHVLFFWLLVQVADVVLPYIGVVNEPVRWAILTGVGLFPATLIIAWFYEHPWTRYTRGRVATDVILIVLIGVGVSTWVLRNLPQVVHARTTIVVLPFEHSGEAIEESVSRALAYEVNSLLMKSNSIDVIGFESSTSSLLNGLDAPSVAERLGVQHVLAGNVISDGASLRIDMRLVDRAGEALWESMIEDTLDNLFSIQEDIASSIELQLGTGSDAVPVAELAARRCWMPTDPRALEKYYTARYYTELRTDTDDARQKIGEAVKYYKELIEEYPDFAEAYSGLAWAYGYQSVYDPDNSRPNRQSEGQPLAETALEHCPTLGEAMHLLPNDYDHENGWIGTHQQLTVFIEMEPHRTENHQRLSRHYAETGLWSRGLEVAENNYRLNPLSVRSVKNLASAYLYMNRIDEAIKLFDLATELGSTGPNYARGMVPMLECNKNTECMLDNLPPGFGPFRESFRTIYPTPAPTSQEEAQVSIDKAMELLAEVPDLTNWFNHSSCRFSYLTPLFFKVADFSEKNGSYWYWPNVWSPECGDVWASPEFPAFIEEAGLVEYWREVGWPEACRPEGDSFTCGLD